MYEEEQVGILRTNIIGDVWRVVSLTYNKTKLCEEIPVINL